jgi:hypothetical protein
MQVCREADHPEDASCPGMDLAAHLHSTSRALSALRELQDAWAILKKSVNDILTYAGPAKRCTEIVWAGDTADRIAELAGRGVQAIDAAEAIVRQRSWFADRTSSNAEELTQFVEDFLRRVGCGDEGSGSRQPPHGNHPKGERLEARPLRSLLEDLNLVKPVAADRDAIAEIATALANGLKALTDFNRNIGKHIAQLYREPARVQERIGSCAGESARSFRLELKSAVSRVIAGSKLWTAGYLNDTLTWREDEEDATYDG